eukprot:2027959-Prymnesium_polylepis.1
MPPLLTCAPQPIVTLNWEQLLAAITPGGPGCSAGEFLHACIVQIERRVGQDRMHAESKEHELTTGHRGDGKITLFPTIVPPVTKSATHCAATPLLGGLNLYLCVEARPTCILFEGIIHAAAVPQLVDRPPCQQHVEREKNVPDERVAHDENAAHVLLRQDSACCRHIRHVKFTGMAASCLPAKRANARSARVATVAADVGVLNPQAGRLGHRGQDMLPHELALGSPCHRRIAAEGQWRIAVVAPCSAARHIGLGHAVLLQRRIRRKKSAAGAGTAGARGPR